MEPEEQAIIKHRNRRAAARYRLEEKLALEAARRNDVIAYKQMRAQQRDEELAQLLYNVRKMH